MPIKQIFILCAAIGMSAAYAVEGTRIKIINEANVGTTVIATIDKYDAKKCDAKQQVCTITQTTEAWKTGPFILPVGEKSFFITKIPSKMSKGKISSVKIVAKDSKEDTKAKTFSDWKKAPFSATVTDTAVSIKNADQKEIISVKF